MGISVPIDLIVQKSAVFAQVDTLKTLVKSADLVNSTVNTGFPAGTNSGISVWKANNRLYQIGTGGILRWSTDGQNWFPALGLPNGGVDYTYQVLYTGTEYQVYYQGNLYYSNDGNDFIQRDIGGIFLHGVVYKDGVLLALAGGPNLARSTDNGVTWTVYNSGFLRATIVDALTCTTTIPGADFIVVGMNTSNRLCVAHSPTGASGTWVTDTLGFDAILRSEGIAFDPDTSKLVIGYSDGTCTITDFDNWEDNLNPTGWAVSPTYNITFNTMIFVDGYCYFCIRNPGGNQIVRSFGGTDVWSNVYTAPAGLIVNSLAKFP